jgi:hypothetical protein
MNAMMKRPGNNPKRRIADLELLPAKERAELADAVKYEPSAHHKLYPNIYGLERAAPRANKSLCDKVRIIPLEEALEMLRAGIVNGMISEFFYERFPKFVWSIDAAGVAYEAKTHSSTLGVYHGYRLEEEDNMCGHVKTVWKQRCK